MDISDTLIAKSDQLNADDLVGGPITVRILGVRRGKTDEQPIEIDIEGHRPFRPCKTVRRVLAAGWTSDSSKWVGQRLTLYRDPDVLWAGKKAGGIRVAAMSGIKGRMTMALATAKGKKSDNVIDVLAPEVVQDRGVLLDLAAELANAGLTVADFDAWRETTGRGPASALTPQEASKIAAWFLALPERFSLILPVQLDKDPEVPF